MRAWVWLRGLAGVLAFFTIGHTAGLLKPPASGSPAAAVFDTMQAVRFPVMGFDRSYSDFYRGFGLFVSVEFALLAVIAFQLGSISRRNPREAMPMAITLQAGCVASAVLSYWYFFAAPIVMSLLAVLCSTVVLVALVREGRSAEYGVAATSVA
jgi:hypothetical protein